MRSRWLIALCLAIVLASLMVVTVFAGAPSPVTDLRVQRSGTSAVLTWTHTDSMVNHYEVWWSDSPYAVPGDAGMVKIADVTPGAAPSEATYTDTASGVGNPGVNSFYAVRGVNAGGETAAFSNRAGEFDFGLNGAVATLPIVDHCGTISANEVWGPNAVHRVTCSVTVASGLKLTVLAGTVVKPYSTSYTIYVYGTLAVQGTAGNPVVFTSFKDDSVGGDTNGDSAATTSAKGDWRQIAVTSTGVANLAYTTLRYGGKTGANSDASLFLSDNAAATLDHVTIADSASYGVYAHAAAAGAVTKLTMTHSTVENNASYGIYATRSNGTTSVTVSGSNISGNGNYGIYNGDTSHILSAENNWWGSDSGPAPYGSGNGISYGTCYDSTKKVNYICQYYVDVDPWLGKEVSTGTQLGTGGPTSARQAFIADPVNTANGNYAHQHTDIAILTRGLPLDLTRSYKSLSPQPGPLGFGWTQNWNLRLTGNTIDSSVAIGFDDGHTEGWTWTGTAYDGGPGVFGTLVKNGDGSFDLTQKDQTRYHFDAAGRLAWAEDKNTNRTTLTYDGQDRLVTVAEPAGRTLTFAYTSPFGANLISRVTDHTARTVLYAYDANADLVSVTDVAGQVTTMTYDANHRLLTMTDANGHTFVRNVYDANNRVSEQYDALNNKWTFAYDEPAHKTLVTDPRNFVTTYTYDGDWRLTSEMDALNYTAAYKYDADNSRTQVTDKRGSVTKLVYDYRGNATTITDALNAVSSFTYDTTAGYNNLLSETNPRGFTTTYEYDARSNLVKRTDALIHVTTWSYDSQGQLVSTTDAANYTTTYDYDTYGYRTSVSNALGHTTTATYDMAGRKLTETDPLGRVTTYTYDPANRVLSISEPLGKTTAYTYDAVGNRITVTENGIRNTQYVYDAKDRLASVTDPLGHVTTYAYDTVDNQVSVTDPLGHATTFTYDALNRRTSVKDALNHSTSYQYDGNGNRTKLTDANNNITQYAYDAMNRLTQVTDAANGLVTYAYDAGGNRTSMTDANNHATTYAYDALNRLTSTTDPLSHVTGYGYDAVGNRTSQAKPDGTTITYGYDALGRLFSTGYPGGSISYAYDAAGNRAALTDASGTTTYTYDDLNRLTQAAAPGGTVGYGYDLFGNRTSLTYPGAQTVTYAYDLANRLTAVTDHASRITQYTYDAANRPTGIQYPNGVQAAYTYDTADRLLSLIHTHPVNGTLASATYTLDAAGNRLTMQDLDGTTSYVYDNLYRLTQVTYPGGEQVTYAYDPMGNRTSINSSISGATSYTYDAADRLLTAGATPFAWDDDGRMTGKGSATYAYDALDRLTQVINDATTVGYAYNGDGVRLSKTVNGATTAYVQDVQASLPVVLTELTGRQTSLYLYGSDLLAQVGPTGDPSYYHADGLGSTRALSNGAGQRTDAYSYDVFGATRSRTGIATQPFTYAGEQEDLEASLVFLRARYYDPALGRFMSRDPVWGIVDVPATMNRYAYAVNNPVVYLDADGEFVIAAVAIVIIGVGIYTGLEEFAQQADRWGTSYGDVLNTAGDPNQKEGDYDRAAERFRTETQNLQKQTLKTALTMPGTSLTGPLSVPSSWKGLGLDLTVDKLKNFLYDRLLGIDSKSGRPGRSTNDWNATFWNNPLPGVGGGGGGGGGGAWDDEASGSGSGSGSWSGPPSQAK